WPASLGDQFSDLYLKFLPKLDVVLELEVHLRAGLTTDAASSSGTAAAAATDTATAAATSGASAAARAAAGLYAARGKCDRAGTRAVADQSQVIDNEIAALDRAHTDQAAFLRPAQIVGFEEGAHHLLERQVANVQRHGPGDIVVGHDIEVVAA